MLKEISLDELSINPMNMFGKDWCLASAGNQENGYNGMTIAWGHIGAIWDRKVNNKKTIIPTACVYIRPQRYTKVFFEKEEYFTICAFDQKYKKALGYMGSHSGKDENKIEKAGLTPLFIDHTIAYKEARMIFVCKKIYQAPLLEENFINKSIADENYPKKDFHEMYIGEILKVYVDND